MLSNNPRTHTLKKDSRRHSDSRLFRMRVTTHHKKHAHTRPMLLMAEGRGTTELRDARRVGVRPRLELESSACTATGALRTALKALSDCGASAAFEHHCRRSHARCQALPAKPMRCRGASRCCPRQGPNVCVSSRVVWGLLAWGGSSLGWFQACPSWLRACWPGVRAMCVAYRSRCSLCLSRRSSPLACAFRCHRSCEGWGEGGVGGGGGGGGGGERCV